MAPPVRFTTYLRNGTELADALPQLDPEGIATLRKRMISSRSQARLRQETFSWQNFSRHLNASSSREVAKVRTAFSNFLVACKGVVAEAAEVEGMTAAVAETIFIAVREAGGEPVQYDSLQDLGAVDSEALAAAIPLAEQLVSLFEAARDGAASPGGLLSPSIMGTTEREYGRDLKIEPLFAHVSDIEEAINDAPLLEQCQKQRTAYIESLQKSSYGNFNVGIGSRVADSIAPNTSSSSPLSSGSKEDSLKPGTAAWMVRRCEEHLTVAPHPLFDARQMAEEILKSVKNVNGNPEALQAVLFDLVGAEGFEFIIEIVQCAKSLLHMKSTALSAAFADAGQPQVDAAPRYNKNSQKGRAAARRQQREIEAANQRMLQEIEMMQSGQNPADVGKKKEMSARELFKLGSTKGATFQSTKLPAGAIREDKPGFSEVTIPAKQRPVIDKSKLVAITEFDDFAQSAFAGISHLNRLQSDLFQVAYHSNRNLLICAPTGAGKTNVAMMTVLREIKQNMDDMGIIDREAFKIIYVAPMKALAQEIVGKFGKRLAALGIKVRELTGDMQLTKAEIAATQMIVTTPEKWDVITRKSSEGGGGALAFQVKLLIIDEVHLLASDRGPVIEVLVARTLRQVESQQSMIRIVGLSATLPNYEDVAMFLRVDRLKGLFFADDTYRPVPLATQYVGVAEKNQIKCKVEMDRIAYEKAVEQVRRGYQVLVFVHSRKGTITTAQAIREHALQNGTAALFRGDFSDDDASHDLDPVVAKAIKQKQAAASLLKRKINSSRNQDLKNLLVDGFGMHNAGMLRKDRNLSEALFEAGLIRCLCCTATLAWGVNLPAQCVIIKGTQLYDAEKGGFTELDVLDVLQIFGRAGRPQYKKPGLGIIITQHKQLDHYLRLVTHQMPMESSFIDALEDHLNAEIVAGTVATVREAVIWLTYTYLYVRVLRNSMAYGIRWDARETDPMLEGWCANVVEEAAKRLDDCRMIRYDKRSGNLAVTALGRTASHYYLKFSTIRIFNNILHGHMTYTECLAALCAAEEFSAIKYRDEERKELDALKRRCCPIEVPPTADDGSRKANILLQTHICGARVQSFTLSSDLTYVAKNAGRVSRALFEIALKNAWPKTAARFLRLTIAIDRQIWWSDSPLRQFRLIKSEVVSKLEDLHKTIDSLRQTSASEIGSLVRFPLMGNTIKSCVDRLPTLFVEAAIQPITRRILRVTLTLEADFEWVQKIHGEQQSWYVWIEDPANDCIYHSELFTIERKSLRDGPQTMAFTIPISEPLPPQYLVQAINDRWLGAETVLSVSFEHLLLPERHPPHTKLLDLDPLPVTALKNPKLEALFPFKYFNPVQTQVFHVCYHCDDSMLIGAPTGSGKTATAEFCMFKVFRDYPGRKVVYIGPLKALVRERVADWKRKFKGQFTVVELTGDHSPDIRLLEKADIIVTTPEKWDGISRSWQKRNYVQKVALVVIDEIHLLGEDRGPVLEVIVSRMRYISSRTQQNVRLVGLSTALANCQDLGDWLGVSKKGLYNFRPSVRPVRLEVHIAGFPGKHYCPRMATMNRPTYAAIRAHSSDKPVLVFVASRRQTRITALELINLAAADNPRQFVLDEEEVARRVELCHDPALKQTLSFGVGIHHAGLNSSDRDMVEELFVKNKIQVLVCTSTLAWGVNFPAHLVVVKGTEFFDGKTQRYVDFPITDVLQMMGRAGRPQFDDHGVAVILVHQPKKNFYRKFLYEPFPVESQLKDVLHEHFNAEIAGGTITCKSDAVDYLTWTYFFRRLLMNPTYYHLTDTSAAGVNEYLLNIVNDVLGELELEGCCSIEYRQPGAADNDGKGGGGGDTITPCVLGHIASYYYLSYRSVGLFDRMLPECGSDIKRLTQLLSDAFEYEELPVRHNEDELNGELAKLVPWPVDSSSLDSPHTKTFLLLQCHFNQIPLPIADYANDLKSVLDQALRVLNAMVDIAADNGLLHTCLQLMHLAQMVVQGRSLQASTLRQLPHCNSKSFVEFVSNAKKCSPAVQYLPQLMALPSTKLKQIVSQALKSGRRSRATEEKVNKVVNAVCALPSIDVSWSVEDDEDNVVRGGSDGAVRTKSSTTVARLNESGEYEINVRLQIKNRSSYKKNVHCPKFPKSKTHGWWLVLGYGMELLALKRLNFSTQLSTSLTFDAPEDTPLDEEQNLQLFLMADSIAGLDQQYDIPVIVSEGDSSSSSGSDSNDSGSDSDARTSDECSEENQ